MAKVASLAAARQKRVDSPKVYSCGKCEEQACILQQDNTIFCGRLDCDARMAADWYVPTDAKTVGKHSRPRAKKIEGILRYYCAYCGYGFFHMQANGSFTCYNKQCRRIPLFRWAWHENLPSTA